MNQISQIVDYIENISSLQIMHIVIAICIIILFRIFSSSMSYIIIRMFKLKTRNKKKIKESAFL